MIHDFNEQLAFSVDSSSEPFWESIYKKAFPIMYKMEVCKDLKLQKQGIDRLLYLRNGTILKIDEKKRRRDWGDILLEYISNDKTNAPGWIEKDLTIDYLAYAFMQSRIVHFFPWLLLRRTWGLNSNEWKSKYRIITARNKNYKTISIAIPHDVLKEAIVSASRIGLSTTHPHQEE